MSKSHDLDVEAFRRQLNQRKEELASLSEAAGDSRKPVELDQQSIGRLSRQDALQQQAMAKAMDARRSVELRKIDAALVRMDDGEFGWCSECGEAIVEKRLEIDPTATYCAPCARSEEHTSELQSH